MIPVWVIKNLKEYGNCALPNAYTKMDRQKLIEKLSKELGEKVVIREAEYKAKEDFRFGVAIKKNTQKITKYLIAETKR